MLKISTLDQFAVNNKNGKVQLATFTSRNIIEFDDHTLKVIKGGHDNTRKDIKYNFAYNELEKWSIHCAHYLPSFDTLNKLFNEIK